MSRERNTAVIALSVVCVLLMGSIIFQIAINSANDRQDKDIRESQYRSCVVNGNTFRDQVRREFVDLKRKVLIPTFAQVAATIPEGAPSKDILDAQVTYLKHRIKTIKRRIPDVDCMDVWPPLEGQTYPRIVAPPNP